MKKTAVALLALGVTSVAVAAPTANNFYFGGKVGQSQYHKTVRLADNNVNKTNHKGDGTTYGFFLGYRLNDHLALELGYQKFANNEYTRNYTVTTATASTREAAAASADSSSETIKGTFAHKAKAVDLSLKANQFIGDKVNVYAGAGVAAVFNKLDKGLLSYTENKNAEVKKTQVAPVVSVGAEYYFADSFAVGVEFKNYFRSYASKGVNEVTTSTNNTSTTKESAAVVNGNEDQYNTKRGFYRPNVQTLQLTGTYVFGQGKTVEVAPVPAPVVTAEKFELSADLLFAYNSYKLSNNAVKAFEGVLSRYNSAKSVNGVTVEGYADRTGSEKYNLALSQKRAQSVTDYLVANGVKPELVTTTGRGETTEKSGGCYDVKNKTKLRACLAPDRRVDVTISGVLK